ncbi:MAG: hypothetical protein U0790_24105 [Isosphaeraceae bacterium]
MADPETEPRHPDAYEALLWIVGHWRSSSTRRDEQRRLGKAVDRLILNHRADLSGHLADRNVAEAFGMGANGIPGPHLDRLFLTCHGHAPDQNTRGRMGLAAKLLRANAELGGNFATREVDPSRAWS